MVTGIGTGAGSSAFFLDNQGASGRARDQATGAASANMHYALRGAKCPKCGKHDSAARRRVYLTSAVRGIPIGLLVGAGILAACKGSSFGWGAGVVACVLIAAIMTVTRSQTMLSGATLHSGDVGKSTTSRLGLY
jgi:hypothetical protein